MPVVVTVVLSIAVAFVKALLVSVAVALLTRTRDPGDVVSAGSVDVKVIGDDDVDDATAVDFVSGVRFVASVVSALSLVLDRSILSTVLFDSQVAPFETDSLMESSCS